MKGRASVLIVVVWIATSVVLIAHDSGIYR
jgi:hypothetical protein